MGCEWRARDFGVVRRRLMADDCNLASLGRCSVPQWIHPVRVGASTAIRPTPNSLHHDHTDKRSCGSVRCGRKYFHEAPVMSSDFYSSSLRTDYPQQWIFDGLGRGATMLCARRGRLPTTQCGKRRPQTPVMLWDLTSEPARWLPSCLPPFTPTGWPMTALKPHTMGADFSERQKDEPRKRKKSVSKGPAPACT